MILRHQILEPSFCPLHGEYAPCLKCLIPEVAEKVSDSHIEIDEGILFQQPDLNKN